jgi:hypothetical protein
MRSARAAEPLTASDTTDISYAADIQPLLAKHCLLCHGPDTAEAGLRLDSAEGAYAELDSGERAAVPGDVEASELFRRVQSDDESLRMPPDADPLSPQEIDQLRRWIEAGAPYAGHWAYQKVYRPDPPKVRNERWARNDIDHFVLARLERSGIEPSVEAAPAALVKRLYYDLVGLPPTPDQVDTFLSDDQPGAYQRLVDRLLASEHFGERWGRHWLDKARFADSDGYEKDRPRPNAWRYRDWVIDAINRDMPFDQFTIEQLAGDLLPEPSPSQQLATAFHRQTLTNTEGGVDKEEFRVEATFDRTETTGAVWMALTMTCARCHSHKYDQITQHDYYRLFAFFNNADEASTEVARSDEALAQYEVDKRQHDEQVATLAAKYERAKTELQPQVDEWLRQLAEQCEEAREQPLEHHAAQILDATTSSKAQLVRQEDGSLLATGPAADKDKYTLVAGPPPKPLTGFRVETLTHDSLGGSGPGRTSHGNFVLSEIRAYVGNDRDFKDHQRIELVAAEADFAQDKFPAEGALTAEDRTGWAISPQMGKKHTITFFTKEPLELGSDQYLQIVLDQQYGGQHTLGRFRVSTLSGFDPLRALPPAVAAAVRAAPQSRSDEQPQAIVDHVASLEPATAKLAKQLEKLKNNAPRSPMMSVRVMGPADRQTTVLHRGDFLQPADEVSPAVLAAVSATHPLTARSPGAEPDRLDLARWLVDPAHPLTSRVTVNHVWAHLFGRGIVATVNDFGVRGESPTHPKLLDYLAWHFPRDMRWSRKRLIKMIVMSATYRQSSHHRPQLQDIDPTNRLLARQNRVRVEAEVVRDLHLSVGGLLSEKVGGPSVYPPLPPGVAELSYANNFKWNTSEGEDRYRRGLYTFFKRTSPHPTLICFDCPDSNTTRLARDSSNTPLQALATLNNAVFNEAAQAATRRVLTEVEGGDRQRLTYALRLCIARQPTGDEVQRFHELLESARDYYDTHEQDAALLTERHSASGISAAENAAWVVTMRMIMNLDEFIVRG